MTEPLSENPETTKESVLGQIDEYKKSLKLWWTDMKYGRADTHREIESGLLNTLLGVYPEEKSKYFEIKQQLEEATPQQILETQRIVRKKYGLPIIEQESNDPNYQPYTYWKRLLEIAKQINVKVVSKPNDTGLTNWGSYDPSTDEINASFNPDKPYISARVLEHELIHALQHRKYPRMTLSEQEHEAFLVNFRFHREKGEINFYLDKNCPSFTSSLLQDMILDFEEKHKT